MEPDQDRHTLDGEISARILRERIIPWLYSRSNSEEEPRIIFIGGQPGAGKSQTLETALTELREHGTGAKLIGDDLRSFHPRFQEYLNGDDTRMAEFTQVDAGRWTDAALEYARQNKFSLVFETTFRRPELVEKTMRDFREAGYEIEARVLAVSPEVSEQGILLRYADQVAISGGGRMVPPAFASAAVEGVLITCDRIQDERLADRVTVYRRGNDAIASFDLAKPTEQGDTRIRGVVEAERDRPMTPRERNEFLANAQELHAEAARNPHFTEEVRERIAQSLKLAEQRARIDHAPHSDAERPIVIIIAGPPGAGKTTLAQSLPENGPKLDADRDSFMRAARLMAEGKSFSHETTLETGNAAALMKAAKDVGFKVDLHYVGLADPAEARARLMLRATADGSAPPPASHEKTFERDQANLPRALAGADTATLYDNAGKSPIAFANLADGKPIEVHVDAPQWARNAIQLAQAPKLQAEAPKPENSPKPKI